MTASDIMKHCDKNKVIQIDSINVTNTNEETQKAIEKESSRTITENEDTPSCDSHHDTILSSNHCLTVNSQNQRPNHGMLSPKQLLFQHYFLVEVPDGCSAQLKSILEKKNSEEDMNRPIYPNLPYSPYGSPSMIHRLASTCHLVLINSIKEEEETSEGDQTSFL